MYKIYEVCGKNNNIVFYFLCDKDTVIIKWFYLYKNPFRISTIFNIDTRASNLNESYLMNEVKCTYESSLIFNNGTMKLNSSPKECIYESSDRQETIDQLEQMRVLLSV